MRFPALVVLAAVLLSAPSGARAAGIYQCKEGGKVVYAAKPCPVAEPAIEPDPGPIYLGEAPRLGAKPKEQLSDAYAVITRVLAVGNKCTLEIEKNDKKQPSNWGAVCGRFADAVGEGTRYWDHIKRVYDLRQSGSVEGYSFDALNANIDREFKITLQHKTRLEYAIKRNGWKWPTPSEREAARKPVIPSAPKSNPFRQYGKGKEGFEAWAKKKCSADRFRYDSDSNVLVIINPSRRLLPVADAAATRMGQAYLRMRPDQDSVTMTLFQHNVKVTSAKVDRSSAIDEVSANCE